MIPVSELPDLHTFLSRLVPYLAEHDIDNDVDEPTFTAEADPLNPEWVASVMDGAFITARCTCNQTWPNVCATIHLDWTKSPCFDDECVVLSNQAGLFVLHTENGMLHEAEMLFREEIFPAFLPGLIRAFPNELDPSSDADMIELLQRRTLLTGADLGDLLIPKTITTIEID